MSGNDHDPLLGLSVTNFATNLPTFHVLTLVVVDTGETGARTELGWILGMKDS